MKNIFTLILLLTCSISHTQSNFNTITSMYCYEIIGDDIMEVDCDETFYQKLPTPVFYGNIDSLCWEMEKRFVRTLNEWRTEHGIHKLEYDNDMYDMLTLPHNEWQLQKGLISHSENGVSLGQRAGAVGISGVGECCAYNYQSDLGELSRFFLQYKNSPPHWSILIDKKYHYIAASVIYDQETNRYYSTVNVRY